MTRQGMITLFGLAAVLGLGGGYLLRAKTQESPSVEGTTSDQSRRSAGSLSEGIPGRAQGYTAEVEDRVKRSQGAHLWLHWMSGIENADLEELAGLARSARENSGVLRLIAYRWAELDPEHLLETIRRESAQVDGRSGKSLFPARQLARYLFEEWPKKDREAAISALEDSESLVGLNSIRHSVLNEVFKSDPKRGLQLMSAWSINHFGPDTRGVGEWARRNFSDAAQVVLDLPVGYGAESTMKAIAKAWAEEDPAAALSFALEGQSKLNRTLRDEVLSKWAGEDRAAAADWLASQDDERVRSQLSPFIVEAWATEDPQAALQWCQDNLEGHRLASAVAKVAEGAASVDVKRAGEMVAGMEPSVARTQAAIAIGRAMFPQSYPSGRGLEEGAVEWVQSLDDPDLQGEVVAKVAWGWAAQDRDSMLEFLASPGGARVPVEVYSTVMHGFARENPQRALEWASQLAGDRAIEASSRAFSVWNQHQPGAALDWFLEMPVTDDRRPKMLRNLVLTTAYFADGELAASSLQRLPAGDLPVIREEIDRVDLPADKKAKLMEAIGK